MAIRLTENRLKDILGASFVGVDLLAADLAADLAGIGGEATDWTKLIQGFTPDVNPSLSTQYGANRAGQTVSQTAHQLHQRVPNIVAGTAHTLSPFFDAMPGVTVFTAATSITATLRLESFAAYPIGSEILIIQGGDGPVTVSAEAGVSIFPTSVITAGKGSILRLFKYAADSWVGSGNIISPGTAYFAASNSSGASNVTGNAAIYTVPFNSEQTDPGNNFASNAYTIPFSGSYNFDAVVRANGITAAATSILLKIQPSTGVPMARFWDVSNGTYGDQSLPISGMMNLVAGVTVTVTLQISGEASNVIDINGGSSSYNTSFSGRAV